MQLSVLLPSHRHDLTALSRIVQACSWASPSIEVLVRDNSGNAEKRALIAQLQRDHCTILSVDPCEPLENISTLVRMAKGDFIIGIGDDDMFFDRAMLALPEMIDMHGADPGVAGFCGTYFLETSKGATITSYSNIDSDDVTTRIAGYLSHAGVNNLYYAAQRRSMVERLTDFLVTTPVYLSFHDQTLCMLCLMSGKFIAMPRVFYGYDVGIWERSESAQKRDVDYYRAAGLDPAVNKLQWFLCGFEGAVLIRNSDLFPDYSPAQRQTIADHWFSLMFQRFLHVPRLTFNSRFADDAEKVCQKLRASEGKLSFAEMLADICQVMALTSPEKAQAYLTFWATQMRPRSQAAAR